MAKIAATDPAAAEIAARLADGAEQIPPWLLAPWRCWHRLNADRPWLAGGMAAPIPGRIPWRDITEWAERHGADLEFLDHCITEMDAEFLAHHASRRPA